MKPEFGTEDGLSVPRAPAVPSGCSHGKDRMSADAVDATYPARLWINYPDVERDLNRWLPLARSSVNAS